MSAEDSPRTDAVIMVSPERKEDWPDFNVKLWASLIDLGVPPGEAFEIRRCSSLKLATIAKHAKRATDDLKAIDQEHSVMAEVEGLWASTRQRGLCATIEPNQSLANAAICDLPQGHDGWCEGDAHGPAKDERPGRHRWEAL